MKHRGFGSYKKDVKKRYNEAEDKKADADLNEVALISHENNILHSIVCNAEFHINNQQIYNSI